jgi:hypothetical protein
VKGSKLGWRFLDEEQVEDKVSFLLQTGYIYSEELFTMLLLYEK